jgi:hypothetical protein
MIDVGSGRSILTINNSVSVVVRGGYANVALLLAPIAGVLAFQATVDLGASRVISLCAAIAIFSIFILIYMRALARLCIEDGNLIAVCAMSTTTVPINEIQKVLLVTISASATGVIVIILKRRIIPYIFYFISPVTNWGDTASTIKKLSTILREHDVSVR